MTDTLNKTDSRAKFTLNEKEHFIDELTDEQRTQLSLIVAAEQSLARLQAEINIIMIGKEKIIADLDKGINNEVTAEASEIPAPEGPAAT
jgi:hypothetical protein